MNHFRHPQKSFLASTVLVSLILLPGRAMGNPQQGLLKPREVNALIAGAATPADHLKLARHFSAKAAFHEAEAAEHEALAEDYAKHPWKSFSKVPMAPNTVEHCKWFAQHCRRAAAEMRALAQAHDAMARDANH